MNLEEIQKLMRIIEESKLSRFRLKKGDFELLLEKGSSASFPLTAPLPAYNGESFAKPESTAKEEKGGSYIKSPMVGTYYDSASPDKPPFVKVGDMVEEGQVVCIIEAMKVMNEVKSDVKGQVKEIFCKNAHPVEFGTKLFRIE